MKETPNRTLLATNLGEPMTDGDSLLLVVTTPPSPLDLATSPTPASLRDLTSKYWLSIKESSRLG
jgi:hypothetical protein